MHILDVLTHNLRHGSRTRRPDDTVPRPAGLRGSLAHTAHLCVGCGSCAYVCSPAAITLRPSPVPAEAARGLAASWAYFAGQCTFCGRCVEYCPTGALAFAEEAPPVTGDQNEHHVEHAIPRRPCARCGRPVVPLPAALVLQLNPGLAAPDLAALRDLCETCRSRASGQRLKDALMGGQHG